jgi:hypothetical protein
LDDIAAMVAEAIARRVKAAQAQAQAQAQAGARAVAGSPQDVRAILARAAARSAPPAPSPALPAAPVALATPPPAPVLPPPEAFAALPATILDDVAAPRAELLNSFSGAGLLSAIVFSEALGKPVALREGGPDRIF